MTDRYGEPTLDLDDEGPRPTTPPEWFAHMRRQLGIAPRQPVEASSEAETPA